ncbi:arsenate reductase family protein [Pricia sp.]|uniref:arsenate reductase family protein n=1 Tax=Pricia sp. TaxID=2268138 RepID=UPI003593A5E6
MGVIAKDDNQITLFYNSETSIGKQTLGYVESSEREILTVDISKTKVTGTQWTELAAGVEIPIRELVDQDNPEFQKAYGSDEVDLDEHDWLRVLEKTPSVLAYPIAIQGKRFLAIKNPSDFAKFIESDSAGIEKPYKKPK